MRYAVAHYQPVRALERGLRILRAANTLRNPTVEAIASSTGLSWSTVFRLLETLEGAGYVRRNADDLCYRPTLASRSLGEGFGRGAWVAEFASKPIAALSQKIVWPVDLLVFENDAMVIVETTHRVSPLSIDRNMIGRSLPLLLTSGGRAYFAFAPAVEREGILERLRRRKDAETDLARNARTLANMVKRTRKLGFGTRDAGYFSHTRSISVPIMVDGSVIACISVIWIASALTLKEGAARFADLLKQTGARIAADMQRANSQ